MVMCLPGYVQYLDTNTRQGPQQIMYSTWICTVPRRHGRTGNPVGNVQYLEIHSTMRCTVPWRQARREPSTENVYTGQGLKLPGQPTGDSLAKAGLPPPRQRRCPAPSCPRLPRPPPSSGTGGPLPPPPAPSGEPGQTTTTGHLGNLSRKAPTLVCLLVSLVHYIPCGEFCQL